MVVQTKKTKLLSSNDEGRTPHQPRIKSSSHSKSLFFMTTLFPLRALHSVSNQHQQESCTVLVRQWNCQLQSEVQRQTMWCLRQSTPDVIRSQHERQLSTMLEDALRPGNNWEQNRHLPHPHHSLGVDPTQIQKRCHNCWTLLVPPDTSELRTRG